ncbi:hypothetical protein [Erythrobacter sp. SG61-1L]|uniref:hypothetical protein n=1 Tax=Erythrobacter sp. SG61-1L TaxID=1603897 RepID=UPI0006C913A1|nr:hypothetical protein [Erythrobacter sp. SG61-1L]
MTIHFAAAEGRLLPNLNTVRARATMGRPANDNIALRPDAARDSAADPVAERAILHAALRQFAQHGIGAADHARNQAERAFFSGDRETYRWWLGVCRTLDRRMAARLASQAGEFEGVNPPRR